MASTGPPQWAGSAAVADSVAHLGAKYGAFISSRKRPASHPLSRSNPGSDHNEANRSSYAIDFATFSGSNLAHALARALGISSYRTGNYTTYTVHKGGATFAVQILWAVSGHFNHVHLGIRHTGGNYQGEKRRTLKPGSRSKDVPAARKLLYKAGADVDKPDSNKNYYGKQMERAVRAFQRKRGLTADGIIGPKTWAALRKAAD